MGMKRGSQWRRLIDLPAADAELGRALSYQLKRHNIPYETQGHGTPRTTERFLVHPEHLCTARTIYDGLRALAAVLSGGGV